MGMLSGSRFGSPMVHGFAESFIRLHTKRHVISCGLRSARSRTFVKPTTPSLKFGRYVASMGSKSAWWHNRKFKMPVMIANTSTHFARYAHNVWAKSITPRKPQSRYIPQTTVTCRR